MHKDRYTKLSRALFELFNSPHLYIVGIEGVRDEFVGGLMKIIKASIVTGGANGEVLNEIEAGLGEGGVEAKAGARARLENYLGKFLEHDETYIAVNKYYIETFKALYMMLSMGMDEEFTEILKRNGVGEEDLEGGI